MIGESFVYECARRVLFKGHREDGRGDSSSRGGMNFYGSEKHDKTNQFDSE